jgi:molecular chaperone HscB
MNDHFTLLGVPRQYALDPRELEQAYLRCSRAVHPDYHTTTSPAEQAASLELCAALNTAYATLRDPFRRAEYLLTLYGGPSAEEHRQMPPEFLAEMLECREQLEEAHHDPQALAGWEADFQRRLDQLCAQLAVQFAELEKISVDDPRHLDIRRRIRMLLNAARYIQGLLRDLHAPHY